MDNCFGDYQHKLRVTIVFLKNDSDIFERNALWIFYCPKGPTNGYWI